MGRDLPDADLCWKLDRELALSAYSVEKLVSPSHVILQANTKAPGNPQ
jgi:hypothetical protein